MLSQRGSVLPITLIMMVVLAIVGIATANSSRIQTLISRNNKLKQLAFQNAETALVIGETAWITGTIACFCQTLIVVRQIYHRH